MEIQESQINQILRSIECDLKEGTISYEKGDILLWQGESVKKIMVLKAGAVKVYSISSDGHIYMYGILGKGGIIGATELLAGVKTKGMFEAIKKTEIIPISIQQFEKLLSTNSIFSNFMMKRLANDVVYTIDKAIGLGFFNVQNRLIQMLRNLASNFGIRTEKGIRITLDITHKDIGELIGANRTTITYFINNLKRQGYLLKEGRQLVIKLSDGTAENEKMPSIGFKHKKGYLST